MNEGVDVLPLVWLLLELRKTEPSAELLEHLIVDIKQLDQRLRARLDCDTQKDLIEHFQHD